MCTGSDTPAQSQFKPPQAAKAPSASPLRRRNSGGNRFVQPAGSTLLTGPNGVDAASMNLGQTTLLGGG